MARPLDRNQALIDAMKSRGLSTAGLIDWVADRAPYSNNDPAVRAWAKNVVEAWLGDNPDAFAPKDWLSELMDIQGLCALRGYDETDVAQICRVPIDYARAWLAGTLPPQEKDAIALLRAPAKTEAH